MCHTIVSFYRNGEINLVRMDGVNLFLEEMELENGDCCVSVCSGGYYYY